MSGITIFASYVRVTPGAPNPERAAQGQLAAIRAYGRASGFRFSPHHTYADFTASDRLDSQSARTDLVNTSVKTPPPFRTLIVSDFYRLSEDRPTAQHIVQFLTNHGVEVHSVDHRLHFSPEHVKARVRRYYNEYLDERVPGHEIKFGAVRS